MAVQGPLRRSSAHASAMSGAVAAFVAVQPRKRAEVHSQQVTQKKSTLGIDSLMLIFVCKMCDFVSRQKKIVAFLLKKNGDSPETGC